MVAGGLSNTDVARREVISGYAHEFYRRAGEHYGMRAFGHAVAWNVEPHVAEAIFDKMAAHPKIGVFLGHRLRERGAGVKEGTKVTSLLTENGASFPAKVFVDATYEGDLMAFAGASYIVGREPQDRYGEYSGGVRDGSPKKLRGQLVRAYDDGGKLLAGVLP